MLETEVGTTLCTSDVDILDLGAFGEMLDDGGTVEQRVDVHVFAVEIACDVAQHNMDAGAEERLVGIGEVIIKH